MQYFTPYKHATDLVRATNKHSLLKSLAVSVAASAIFLSASFSAHAETEGLEKDSLKLGFIKLTDMAPLAIAYEKGYFEDEGLYVTIEAQANGKFYWTAL